MLIDIHSEWWWTNKLTKSCGSKLIRICNMNNPSWLPGPKHNVCNNWQCFETFLTQGDQMLSMVMWAIWLYSVQGHYWSSWGTWLGGRLNSCGCVGALKQLYQSYCFSAYRLAAQHKRSRYNISVSGDLKQPIDGAESFSITRFNLFLNIRITM